MERSDTLLNLRVIEAKDYPQIAELMDLVFHDVGGAWPRMTIMLFDNDQRLLEQIS